MREINNLKEEIESLKMKIAAASSGISPASFDALVRTESEIVYKIPPEVEDELWILKNKIVNLENEKYESKEKI